MQSMPIDGVYIPVTAPMEGGHPLQKAGIRVAGIDENDLLGGLVIGRQVAPRES